MYPIDSNILDAFMQGKPQKVTIFIEKGDERIIVQDNSMMFYMTAMVDGELTYVGSEAYPTITQKDIIVSGLTINRYASTADGIGIGMAIPAELNVTFNNVDGKYDSSLFEDAEIRVELSVEGFEDRAVPYGTFIVDEINYDGTNIELTAYDRLVLMDSEASFSGLSLPATVTQMGNYITQTCGINVDPRTPWSSLPNASYTITTLPEGQYTYRQYLKWLLEIVGCNAYMDYADNLSIRWYSRIPTIGLTTSERFSSKKAKNPLTITGVQCINNLTNIIDLYEETGIPRSYTITIEGNPLITHDGSVVCENIGNKIIGYSWVPFEAQTLPLPQVYPMDCMNFIDRNEDVIRTCITDVTYTLNKNTMIASKGKTSAYERRGVSNNKTEQHLASRLNNAYVPGTDTLNGQRLADNSVTVDKLSVNSLQAISAVLGGFLIVNNNITNTNSSTDITQNPQIKFERNTGNAYEYAYVIYSFPTYELYYRDVVTNMSSHYPTDVKISINDKGSMTWKYNLYPSTGTDLPEESDYEATPTQTYNNSMGLPLGLGSDIFSYYYGNGVEFEVAQSKQIKMRKTSPAVGENALLDIEGGLKASGIECKSFNNIRHDRRSATIGANVGTSFALQYATDVIGNNPIVQITLGNRYFRVSNISISTSGTNTIVTISIVNESNSQQTGMVYTSLFYSNNYG